MTPTTPPTREKRRHQRWSLGHYLPVSVPQWSEFAVWGSDLSRGGLGLKTDEPVSVGDRFVVGLPGSPDPIEAEVCNVVWLEEEERYAVGLRWQPKNDIARTLLERFFEQTRG